MPVQIQQTQAYTPRSRADRNGFSLIELMISSALVVILYVMYLGPGTRNFQTGKMAVCRQNLQFIHSTLLGYATEHEGKFPAVPGAKSAEQPLSLLIPKHSTRTSIFICPASKDRSLPDAQPFGDRRISYAYVMGLGGSTPGEQWIMADSVASTQGVALGQPLFSTDKSRKPGNNHRQYGGVILFVDGHVEDSPAVARRHFSVPTNSFVLNPKP